ncbi:MAG: hypothetical protein QOF94_2140 [Acidobacteriaceae bacterium]
MHNKIRVLRVLRYVFPHRRTNDVHPEIVFSGPAKCSFRQSGRKTQMTQFFWNFSMNQLQDISAQAVFKISHFTVLLDFEAASRYHLRLWRLAVKDFPHGLNALFLRTATYQD